MSISGVISFVGEKAATFAIKQAIKGAFDEQKSDDIIKLLFNQFDPQEMEQKLDALTAEIRGLRQQVKELDQHAAMAVYDDAYAKFINLVENILSSKKSGTAVPDSYKEAVARDGLHEQVGRMASALTTPSAATGKMPIQEMIEYMVREYYDAYACMEIVDGFIFGIAQNMALADVLCEKVKEMGVRDASEPYVGSERLELLKSNLRKALPNLFALRDSFNKWSETGRPVLLQHDMSKKCLTGYANGRPLSGGMPRFGGQYDYIGMADEEQMAWGMPQVFLYEYSEGKTERFVECASTLWTKLVDERDPGDAPKPRHTHDDASIPMGPEHVHVITMDRKSQGWRISKSADDKGRIRVLFQHVESGKYLAGTNKGRVYLADHRDECLWWLILDRDPQGDAPGKRLYETQHKLQHTIHETPRFLLRSYTAGGYALDSDGTRVYADSRVPDYENSAMKWRIVDLD